MSTAPKFTPKEDAIIREMRADDNWSWGDIAQRLQRTKASVIARGDKLGLHAQSAPTRREC